MCWWRHSIWIRWICTEKCPFWQGSPTLSCRASRPQHFWVDRWWHIWLLWCGWRPFSLPSCRKSEFWFQDTRSISAQRWNRCRWRAKGQRNKRYKAKTSSISAHPCMCSPLCRRNSWTWHSSVPKLLAPLLLKSSMRGLEVLRWIDYPQHEHLVLASRAGCPDSWFPQTPRPQEVDLRCRAVFLPSPDCRVIHSWFVGYIHKSINYEKIINLKCLYSIRIYNNPINI